MPVFFYDTMIGKIGIAEKEGLVTNLYFQKDEIPYDMEIRETQVIKDASSQLRKYLEGSLKEFSIKLAPGGTIFMKKVWNQLYEIPYGDTITYRELAFKIGSPRSARAVGLANSKNPIPIFIPCHRVIGSDGSLTGYRGGLEIKRRILEMEKEKRHAIF